MYVCMYVCIDTATAFLEPSFPTIAGVNKNGAIIHYRLLTFHYNHTRCIHKYIHTYIHELHTIIKFRAVPESCLPVGRNDLVLLDSGGQYLDGTTGKPTMFYVCMYVCMYVCIT